MLASTNIFPRTFTLANFEFISGRTPFWTFLMNSAVLSGGGTVLGALPAAWAGYALSRFRGRGLSLYGRLLLVVQMFPIIVALIPLFILFRMLGLINNPLSVMIIHAVIHLPFATWLMRSYFDTIPRELEEAAQVDGCTRTGALRRILLPLSGPGIAAVLIFSFLQSYNEFFIASVFLRDVEVMPIPVGIQMFTAAVLDRLGQPDGRGDGDDDPDLRAVPVRAEMDCLRRGRGRREGMTIGLGIIGCGSVTQIIHLPALAQIPACFRVAALCDVSRRHGRWRGGALERARALPRPSRGPRRGATSARC
jgi:ABC-type glycerol-3-phosphate transport system permease component